MGQIFQSKEKSRRCVNIVKTDSRTACNLQTCKILEIRQLLNEITSKEGQKQEPVGASMEKICIEKLK